MNIIYIQKKKKINLKSILNFKKQNINLFTHQIQLQILAAQELLYKLEYDPDTKKLMGTTINKIMMYCHPDKNNKDDIVQNKLDNIRNLLKIELDENQKEKLEITDK